MSVQLTFLGAAGGVTGSRYKLDVGGKSLLVDCGLFQGRRAEAREKNLLLPFDPKDIDAVVLTHAHIDHSGSLPVLTKHGYSRRIWATEATADLAKIMLQDSAHIQESDANYLNKKKDRAWADAGRRGRPDDLVEPLYDGADAERCGELFSGIPYHTEREILPGITLSFSDQGHIIGSAAALLKIKDGDRTLKICFGGDRGRPHQPILKDPEPYPDCDVLLTESTYGGRMHPDTDDMRGELMRIVKAVIEKRSKLVVPAFSVGRTQNLLYYLCELMCAGLLPSVPTFVDSPLSSKATQIYAKHPECFDEPMLKLLSDRTSPFAFDGLEYVESVEDSIRLNDRSGPMIIISASGMCESGRVLHHLRQTLPDMRNVVALVGFMAENTVGRRLRDGATDVRIHDRFVPVRATIENLQGLSAHADHGDLLHSTSHLVGKTKTIFVVHGEKEGTTALEAALHEQGHSDVRIAEWRQTVDL